MRFLSPGMDSHPRWDGNGNRWKGQWGVREGLIVIEKEIVSRETIVYDAPGFFKDPLEMITLEEIHDTKL